MAQILASQNKPRRVVRLPIASPPIDLGVTPPAAGSVAGQITAGEMVYLSNNNKVASLNTTGSSNANAAKMIGVSMDTYPVTFTDGVTGSPVPPTDAMAPRVQLYEDGEHLFNTTAGDSYQPYDALYLGVDGKTVSKTVSGTSVGYVSPDQRQSAGLDSSNIAFPIAGGAGIQIYVRITPALAK
ncbi:MAG TPA: hypothetical protein VHR97_01680 [Candidatus Baltobacteraceae bacterium]|jgi:hypothetical protein|nr:hypothetical protein [Candidatus Baltobacteraceae bacterium]